jgi:arsenite methyltransferase
VLDLGSGAGIDCFLAARRVGPAGRVIGVDMTPEMIERARANAGAAGIENVEFRLGHIEDLPVESESVDVIISNCVINLSPDKPRVFAEAFRVLRPGGQLLVSDLVLTRPLSDALRASAAAYAACIGGAEMMAEYLAMISAAGFVDRRLTGQNDYLAEVGEYLDDIPADVLAPGSPVAGIHVSARKPG